MAALEASCGEHAAARAAFEAGVALPSDGAHDGAGGFSEL